MNAVELRSAGGGKVAISLYACVTGQRYSMGSYEEEVQRGAFTRTLKNVPPPDCILTIEHKGLALASTRPVNEGVPSLKLEEDATGLRGVALLSEEDPDVKLLQIKSQQAPLESSFRFSIDDQAWSDSYEVRTIKSANLHRGDISIVGRAASEHTQGLVDLERGQGGLEERKRLADGLGRRWVGGGVHLGSDVPTVTRGKYSAAELAEFGERGEALLGPSGKWSYPTPTVGDWEKARTAVSILGPAFDHVRKYLIARALALDIYHMVPETWKADGSLKRGRSISVPDSKSAEQDLQIRAARAGVKIRPSPRAVVNARQNWQEAQLDVLARRGRR